MQRTTQVGEGISGGNVGIETALRSGLARCRLELTRTETLCYKSFQSSLKDCLSLLLTAAIFQTSASKELVHLNASVSRSRRTACGSCLTFSFGKKRIIAPSLSALKPVSSRPTSQQYWVYQHSHAHLLGGFSKRFQLCSCWPSTISILAVVNKLSLRRGRALLETGWLVNMTREKSYSMINPTGCSSPCCGKLLLVWFGLFLRVLSYTKHWGACPLSNLLLGGAYWNHLWFVMSMAYKRDNFDLQLCSCKKMHIPDEIAWIVEELSTPYWCEPCLPCNSSLRHNDFWIMDSL